MIARIRPFRGWRWFLWGIEVCLVVVLLDQLAYCEAENRVLLQLRAGVVLSSADMNALRNETLFSAMEVYTREEATAAVPAGRSTNVVCWQVGSQTLKREQLLYGRTFFPEDVAQNFILVTQDTAETLFGRLDVVGETLQVKDRLYQVVGVLRRPWRISERLAYYDMPCVFFLHGEKQAAAYITATLQTGISGDLALSWLNQQPVLSSKVDAIANLQVIAGLTGLYARLFLLLYALLLFRIVWRRLHSLRKRLWINISHLWVTYYPLKFFRRALGCIAALAALVTVPWLALLCVLRWLLNIEGVPPSLRPTRLMLSNITQALERFVDFINSQGICDPFFTLQWPWVRLEMMILGLAGIFLLYQLTKTKTLGKKEAEE